MKRSISSISSIIRFFRPANLTLIALYYVLFDLCVLEPVRNLSLLSPALSWFQLVLLIGDVLIVTLIGYWLNDWFDVETDRINKPNRFLVANQISFKSFSLLVGSMVLMGFVITMYLAQVSDNLRWVWIYPLILAVLYYYARKGKKGGLIGNLLVSVLIAVLPVLLIIAEWRLFVVLHEEHAMVFDRLLQFLVVYAALMFSANMAREVVKDLEDEEGDRVIGSQSLPITKGSAYSHMVITGFLLVAIMGELYLCLVIFKEWMYFGLLLSAFMLAVAIGVHFTQDTAAYRRWSTMSKVILFLGILQLGLLLET